MPRFVILRHDSPDRGLHWDFMLECNDALLTWALESEPAFAVQILANQLANHRLEYLIYEGDVSGGRGTVSRFDAGEFRWHKRSESKISMHLHGEKLQGMATLERVPDSAQRWVILFSETSSSID